MKVHVITKYIFFFKKLNLCFFISYHTLKNFAIYYEMCLNETEIKYFMQLNQKFMFMVTGECQSICAHIITFDPCPCLFLWWLPRACSLVIFRSELITILDEEEASSFRDLMVPPPLPNDNCLVDGAGTWPGEGSSAFNRSRALIMASLLIW